MLDISTFITSTILLSSIVISNKFTSITLSISIKFVELTDKFILSTMISLT
jgi:hypothetical protein